MSFTHDLKTSLASLQLQAESLQEDLPEAAANPNLDRLLKDARRLQLQLENSLYFAQPTAACSSSRRRPCARRARRGRLARAARPHRRRRRVLADERAVDSVMRNLLQNAFVHGAAREVTVLIARGHRPRVDRRDR